jgi:hypothetical protein
VALRAALDFKLPPAASRHRQPLPPLLSTIDHQLSTCASRKGSRPQPLSGFRFPKSGFPQASADPVTGATLYQVFQRAAGSTGDPTLVTSAETLPTSFTISAGDYEFTMVASNEAGESAPSAPVTVTVT